MAKSKREEGSVDLEDQSEGAPLADQSEESPTVREESPAQISPEPHVASAQEPRVAPAQQIFSSDDEAVAAGLIASAGIVDEDEWEKVFLDLKSRGNYFDLIKNMYPLHLPEECKKMQDREERRYGWFGRESMKSKCEPSSRPYWTPVNAVNHSMLQSRLFDRNGGVCSEGMYLCYMPWKMYRARQEILDEANRLKYDLGDPLEDKEADGVGHYKPAEGPGGGDQISVGEITHAGRVGEGIPLDESFSEAGEYED